MSKARTVAGQWRVDGKCDPFDGRYHTLGEMRDSNMPTKDLAEKCDTRIFGVGSLHIAELIKERMRYLSRLLVSIEAHSADAIQESEEERAELKLGKVSDDALTFQFAVYADDTNDIQFASALQDATRERLLWLDKRIREHDIDPDKDVSAAELHRIDPYDPDLTEEQKKLVLEECKKNPAYFYAAVLRYSDKEDNHGFRSN